MEISSWKNFSNVCLILRTIDMWLSICKQTVTYPQLRGGRTCSSVPLPSSPHPLSLPISLLLYFSFININITFTVLSIAFISHHLSIYLHKNFHQYKSNFHSATSLRFWPFQNRYVDFRNWRLKLNEYNAILLFFCLSLHYFIFDLHFVCVG